jgi:hypothetical protein
VIVRVRQTVSIDSSSQAGKERAFLEREAQPRREWWARPRPAGYAFQLPRHARDAPFGRSLIDPGDACMAAPC